MRFLSPDFWRKWLPAVFQSPRFRALADFILPKGARGDWLVWGIALLGVLCSGWWLVSQAHPWDLKELARLADGTKRKYKDFMAPGLWYGALLNVAIWLPMVLFSRFWPKGEGAHCAGVGGAQGGNDRRFWPLVLGIILVAGVVRWQRMDLSYWGDEGWAVTRYGHGLDRPAERGNLQGRMVFIAANWEQVFFDDHTGGNHYLFTAAQRATLDAWRAVTGRSREAFDETVSRLPAFLAGLGSLVILAGMLRWWGQSTVGVWACFFLAFHPMHLRYSSEARGYSLMLCFLLATLWFSGLALKTGRWRWWLLFGLAEFLTMYSWKGIYYGLALLNLVLVLILLFAPLQPDRPAGRARWVSIGRWTAASLFAAGLFAHLVMPCVLQGRVAAKIAGVKPMYLPWLKDALSQFFIGMNWDLAPDNPSKVASLRLLTGFPGVSWPLLTLFSGLLGVGLVSMVKRAPHLAAMGLALVVSCVVGALHFKYKVHLEWLAWYSFYAVPVISVALAFGADRVVGSCAGIRRHGPRLAGLAGSVVTVCYLLVILPQTRYMVTHPVEANREAFEVTRGLHEPMHVMSESTVFTVYLWRYIGLYDPRADIHVRDASTLKAKIADVEAVGGELYVVMGERALSELLNPDMVAMLRDPRLFTNTRTFHAQDESLTLYVFHYTGPK